MQGLILLTILCAIGLQVCSAQYQYPVVSVDTPKDSVCPPAGVLASLRDDIRDNVSVVLQVVAAELNGTIEEIDLNDTTEVFVSECGGYGWRRVAFLNMTDANQSCPNTWREYSQDSFRFCGRQQTNFGSCSSVNYSPDGLNYTEVCGRIIGYQYATPDGRDRFITLTPGSEIDELYVDGVSITYGSPRQHIWTLYAGHHEFRCCGSQPPSFVGQNFFCDTGNPAGDPFHYSLHDSHLLWDGDGCTDDIHCCAPSSGPWFNTTLPAPTAEDIEIRICGDQQTTDEDTPLELIEIYVK